MRKTIGHCLFLLDNRERSSLWKVIGTSIGMGLAEVAAVLSIAPFLMVATDPDAALRNSSLNTIYDLLGFSSSTSFLIGLAIGSLAMLGTAILFRIGGYYFLRSFVRRQSVSLALRLVVRYMNEPLDRTHRRHSAELVTNIQSEVERVVNGVMMNSVRLMTGVSTAACLAIMLIIVEPRAALTMALLLGCGYFAAFALVRSPMRRIGVERMAATRETARLLSEALAGSREMKLYGMECNYLERFEHSYRCRAEASTRSDLLRDIPKSILEILTFGTMILLVIWTLVEEGESSVALPLVALYAFAAARLFPSLQRIYAAAATLRTDLPALEEIYADLAAVGSTAQQVETTRTGLRLEQALELRAVSYSYPDRKRQLIKNLDVSIPARSIIGVVGATGAGKSTILDMITGLTTPNSGTLTVDGEVIDASNVARWRASVAYVPQDICMIGGTIRDNIVFGAKSAGDVLDRIRSASAFAGLGELIAELPEGYDTQLSERGLSLSVGQRQRVGIARAIFRNPELLVMDESASGLDTISEVELTAAVQSLRGKKTVVIVAHRLSAVRNCDLIYLIGEGRVLESGTHDELTKHSSKFNSFYRAGT
ncbi:ABC transporter ATP-binding protein [Parasedimentitalea psychrophila]|uniref:ABC transporter ATP-binding protein n=1 Tax=Parasedimentitalea psychrophila TaxID=2997337 RepID=A0A9Y2KXW1_9RHOB|nr:ABC transporter ATP-binding protein [Parasedimentitalea psychrophila]WIY24325.1 ABC transporter ATP-binding protein [Parasedimentitalea psychrophila]